jgi:hypothetical protein
MQHSKVPQVAQVQFQAAGSGRFTTVKRVTVTDPYGYFDTLVTFPSSGNVRITWSYPHGATIRSRTVPITIR